MSNSYFRFSALLHETRRSGTPDGLPSFQEWAAQLLGMVLNGASFNFAGGIIFPQQGAYAGEKITFYLDHAAAEDELFKAIDVSLADILRHLPDVFPETIECHGAMVALAPIEFGFHRPIGAVWACVNSAGCPRVKSALSVAGDILGLINKSEKADVALGILGQEAWLEGKTIHENAKYIAEKCRDALSCADVIIWETDNSKKILKVIAATSVVSVDMKLGVGVAGKVATDSNIIVVDDLLNDGNVHIAVGHGLAHKKVVEERGWKSGIFVPLDIGGEIAGVIGIYGARTSAMTPLDQSIALAFAQRLAASYVHVRRMTELLELERKLASMAPTISTSMLAMERIHDAMNGLLIAVNQLTRIEEQCRDGKNNHILNLAVSARKQIEKAQQITKKISDTSQVRTFKAERCNVKLLFSEIVQRVKVGSSSYASKIDFDVECSDDVTIRCDRDQIERVVTNIVNNSIYFLDHDGKYCRRTVRMSCELSGSFALMSIFDNGPGIDSSNIGRIFDYTYTSRGDKGMGFGLGIAKRIIEEHGGIIWAESDWGEWTKIYIKLPLVRSQGYGFV